MKLVGSKAIADILKRNKRGDTDFLCTENEVSQIRKWLQNSKILVDKSGLLAIENKSGIFEYDYRPTTQTLLKMLGEFPIQDIDLVYMLKMSHRYLRNSPHFLKTMNDIHTLRKHSARIPSEYLVWFKERERETYNYGHPKLNQMKQTFFDDSVKYTYDHDSIHRTIALYDRPAYEFYKDDTAEVWCSKEKFFELPESYRLAGVYEEAGVLALERSLIPFEFVPKETYAFKKALEKVCTSITSGWFREYAWEHYHQVLGMHSKIPYYLTQRFNNGVESGVIKESSQQQM